MSALPTPCLLLFSRHQTKLHLTNPKEGADENAVSLMTFPERSKTSQQKLPALLILSNTRLEKMMACKLTASNKVMYITGCLKMYKATLDSNGVQFLKSTNATNAIIALLNNYMHHYIR